MRLDGYIANQHPDISRSRARALIEAGAVSVNTHVIRKPAYSVKDSDTVCVDTALIPYVSRGGLKLAAALDAFDIFPDGLVCVDVGASTGGFTDCLLRRGAMRVYAVDAGRDQLAASLRCDARVISIEQFNARTLDIDVLGEPCDIAVADLSFISQSYVLSPIFSVLKMGGIYIGLIKPQFECGPASLGKNGIVRDARTHYRAVSDVLHDAADVGFCVTGLIRSPVTGGDGNVEFLYVSHKAESGAVEITEDDIRSVVFT